MLKDGHTIADRNGSKVNWQVLVTSSLIILAFSIWAIFAPDNAAGTMKTIVGWVGVNVGWIYVVTVTVVIGFVIWVALSPEGKVRMGPDHSRPQYNLLTWAAMLFAAGVGIDMLFYSVGGPISHYVDPPNAEPRSPEALQDSVIWTMFHYGMGGWAMYSLLGMAMGYFAYRWGMPLSIRAALYPLLGRRVRGSLGDGISIIALVGTVFGVATAMGIGAVLLSVGFTSFFGLAAGQGRGDDTMEFATLIFALPVTIIAYLVMASFHKVLRMERAEREGQVLHRRSVAPIGGHVPERSWKQRLEQLRSYPSLQQVVRFLDRTVRPALDELAAEFRNQGYEVEQTTMTNAHGVEEPVLRVSMDTFRAFHYQVAVVEAPVPMFSGRMTRETDVYYRLEVFTQTGSGGYDLMGLTKQQVIDDVLERYEAHLVFLTVSSERDTASVLTPAVRPQDELSALPRDASDVQDLGGPDR